MKKFFFCLFIFSVFSLKAQISQKTDFNFVDASFEEVILQIESKTSFRFYYVDTWLPDKKISGTYSDVEIQEVLQDIFDNTLLNFHVDGDRIILTRNNIIYDELPENFFGKQESEVVDTPEEKTYNPVFYEDVSAEQKPIETITIGRADRSQGKSRLKLSGVVTSAEDGAPIPNLAISVRDREIGTVTDSRGQYSLNLPPGVHIIETRSFGSEDVTKRVVIYNDGQLNLSLREDFEQLGEVLLESNPNKNVSDAVGGSEEINVEEIKNIPLVLGERNILKVSTTLPGISTAGEGAAGFNVRGGRSDQNLILLDNAVIYNPSHFFGIFSALNPFTTGTVDIYKGHIPANYGGRLSSVFDIKTKDANVQEFAGEGSIGPVTGNLTLEVPIVKEKAGFLVGVRSTYSDWILKSLEEESLRDNEASFYDVVAKYNHKIGMDTDVDLMGYFSNDRFNITPDSLYSYSNRLLSMEVGHRFNDSHQGKVILTNSNYNFNIDYAGEFTNDFRSGYGINETEAKVHMRYRLNSKHRFDYGVSAKLYLVEPGEISPQGENSAVQAVEIPREKGVESAVFLGDEFIVNEKLLLSGGLRFSLFTALGEGTERIYQEGAPRQESSVEDVVEYGNNEVIASYGGPELRLAARYLLQEDLSVKASYNSTYQYIHTLSTNTTASPTDTYKLSDGIVKPQQANNYSLGFYKNLFQNTYELSLEGYYKTSNDILDYKVGAQLFLNETIETEILQGEGKSHGVEFLLKKTKGNLNGWVGYSYSRSFVKLAGEFKDEIVNNGEFFPSNFDKPHDFSMVANYKFTRRFSLSANFVYQTGRPITYPVGKYNYNGAEYVMYSDRNEFRIPDYYRLDLSFNIEGNHKIQKLAHSFWNISVYNVLGRNNPYSVFFVTEGGKIKAYKSSIFSIPVPTITYNFKF
ncbi:carboxypeptidase-like regulatory domain-containing protein [Salinimicrobium xinjiangense]|uniref:carboxypeptidase-like regulatory domain-containing protein n=1 Tax=Salinimicrobium xinjiangense TaxID=438596 RepID=UPI00041BF92F|nr:carboxypeptidase-like regulatory domain-containing protein [Salinimicrobium xinjiangense]